MATQYSISYDLMAPGKNYDSLIAAIRGMGGEKAMLSQWIVARRGTSAVVLRDYLWQFMDGNDRLLVMEIDGTLWASYNLLVDINRKAA